MIQLLAYCNNQIDCGNDHCLALSKDYQLYAWGSNESHQLGIPKVRLCTKPQLIPAFNNAKVFKVKS